ncbi:TrmH family RNA methyltransferase [Bacillus massiliigorillae]|uniref:TrmH family RNA methyltransferase n=1 Tax=Bacillus massiliigorillae TaxID=1243664 RepID=UPI0003A3ABCF|nr:RNA methyltransferase [Bacillus massiliigorillae]
MKFIQSVQNEKVKEWKKLTAKKGRDKAGQFIVEGFHLVEEALKKDYVSVLIVDEHIEIPHGWNVDNQEIYHVSSAVAKALAETETTQGIFAICDQKQLDASSYSRVLLLDGVQDPGNIGTIIRTADAAGVELIVCGNGCVDVYNGKSLRSTQGSIFHIPVIKGDLQEWIPKLQAQGITVYGTSLQDARDYREVELSERYALVMGNEGNGVSAVVLQQCNQNLYIPILGEAESLNVTVATGILLYQFCK